MKENDIAVNLDALDSTGGKLSRIMNELTQFALQLVRNMEVAGKEFDSANFERANTVVKDVMKKLAIASEKMERAGNFLKQLENKAEFYLKCKYIG